jgi:hypothetical protein
MESRGSRAAINITNGVYKYKHENEILYCLALKEIDRLLI